MQHYHLISSGLVSSPVYQLFPPFRSRVSLLFPPDFFFILLSPTLPLPSLFTFTFLFTSSSSLPLLTQFDFFVLKSCLFVRCLLGSRYFSSSSSIFSLIFFPVTPFLLLFFHSIHRHHLISTLHVCIRFFLYRNPHRAFAILSPVVFTTSIQSYLIWRRLA